jgi:hypothetical protein
VTKFIDNYENLQNYNRNLIKELMKIRPALISGEKIHIPK